MSRNLILIIALFFLGSCYNENKPQSETPASLLSEEKIVEILTDLQLAEAIIATKRLEKANQTKESKDSIYQIVFDHYGITPLQLKENLDYYNTDIEKMETLYEQVLVNLSKQESELQLESRKQDSISNKVDKED